MQKLRGKKLARRSNGADQERLSPRGYNLVWLLGFGWWALVFLVCCSWAIKIRAWSLSERFSKVRELVLRVRFL